MSWIRKQVGKKAVIFSTIYVNVNESRDGTKKPGVYTANTMKKRWC